MGLLLLAPIPDLRRGSPSSRTPSPSLGGPPPSRPPSPTLHCSPPPRTRPAHLRLLHHHLLHRLLRAARPGVHPIGAAAEVCGRISSRRGPLTGIAGLPSDDPAISSFACAEVSIGCIPTGDSPVLRPTWSVSSPPAAVARPRASRPLPAPLRTSPSLPDPPATLLSAPPPPRAAATDFTGLFSPGSWAGGGCTGGAPSAIRAAAADREALGGFSLGAGRGTLVADAGVGRPIGCRSRSSNGGGATGDGAVNFRCSSSLRHRPHRGSRPCCGFLDIQISFSEDAATQEDSLGF